MGFMYSSCVRSLPQPTTHGVSDDGKRSSGAGPSRNGSRFPVLGPVLQQKAKRSHRGNLESARRERLSSTRIPQSPGSTGAFCFPTPVICATHDRPIGAAAELRFVRLHAPIRASSLLICPSRLW